MVAMTQIASKPLGPLHRAWRLLPAGPRRAASVGLTAMLAPRLHGRPPKPAGGMVVVGEIGLPSGLGESARVLAAGLRQMGLPIWSMDTGLPGSSMTPPTAMPDDLPAAAALLLHVNPPLLPYALLRLPRRLARGRRVIGYWAWELPVMPPEWLQARRFVHEVWATSRFTAAALAPLERAGVTVRAVPIPLALTPPQPSRLDRAAFGLPDSAVVVLMSANLASSFVRKNPLAAVAAHRAAFGGRADRILVLKIGNPGHFPADMAQIQAAVAGAANIRLLTETLPMADAHALTAASDIVLSMHRSEGFGLVPAEAMLLGRAVVATGWSGNMDFMDADSAALLTPRLIPVADPRQVYPSGTVWADPDPGEAAVHLRRLADDADARIALGERGRAMAKARLGPEALAAALRAVGFVLPSEGVPPWTPQWMPA